MTVDGTRALRIDRDGPHAKLPVNISPSAMPEVTLVCWVKLNSVANNRGWLFGNEVTGYDRTILMHDNRFGGALATAVGRGLIFPTSLPEMAFRDDYVCSYLAVFQNSSC